MNFRSIQIFLCLATALFSSAAAQAIPIVCRTEATRLATNQLHVDLLEYDHFYEVYMGEPILESIEPETYRFSVLLELIDSYSYVVSMDASDDCRLLKIEKIRD